MSVSLSVLKFVIVLMVYTTPFVFRWLPSLERGFIFVPHSDAPADLAVLKNPEDFGFVGGRNFYLKTKDGASLGVWHTLPSNLERQANKFKLSLMDREGATEIYNNWMADATVFFYAHGNGGARSNHHELQIYRILNNLNYHVIAFDYRGYADSTGSPMSEENVVEDALTVYDWIKERVVSGKIFAWGHSLGSSVLAHASNTIVNRGNKINGIVLEAPYNNMADAVKSISLTKSVSSVPWFDYFCIQPLYKNDLSFQTDRYLKSISTPVLILHAKDDLLIPYSLGLKLFKSVAESRKDPNSIQIVSYNYNLGYGHFGIYLDPNLNVVVKQFVEEFYH